MEIYRIKIILEEKQVKEWISTECKEDNYPDEAQKLEAKRKDRACRSIIVQYLDDNQLEVIRDKNTAYHMWQVLQERYEKRGLPRQMILRKKTNINEIKTSR